MECMGRKRKSATIRRFFLSPQFTSVTIHMKGTEHYVPVVLHVYYAVQSTIMDKSLGTLLRFWGDFQFTQVQPLPSPHKQCCTHLSRIFPSSNFWIGWGRENCKKISKRMHYFKREPGNDRIIWIFSTVPRTFVQDCSSNFWACKWNPTMWAFKWKLLSSTFLWYCLFCWITQFLLMNLRQMFWLNQLTAYPLAARLLVCLSTQF